MAKRMTKTEIKTIFWLAVIAMPILLIMRIGESMGWIPLILIISAITGLIFWNKAEQKKKRYAQLMKKYQDEKLVESLMNQIFWQGQTADQLLDSLGSPHDIDQKILKTKKKEVWKYEHQGGNRYGLRITLDDDYVVGWDQKT